jgi:hypothetical protein
MTFSSGPGVAPGSKLLPGSVVHRNVEAVAALVGMDAGYLADRSAVPVDVDARPRHAIGTR